MAEKKFLDQEGVKYLWSKISMGDYPNNDTLVAVLNAIDETKQDKIIGKGLSTNDFTTEEKNKLASLKNTTIDTTLTISNAAADAKAVGDALAGKQPIGDYALKSDVENVEVPNSNLINGSAEGSLRTTGSFEESNGYTLGTDAFAQGSYTKAFGNNSYAEGTQTASVGNSAHSAGQRTLAYGAGSYAAGLQTVAIGKYSHTEGIGDVGNIYMTVALSGEANATTYTIDINFADICPGTIIFAADSNNEHLKNTPIYAKVVAIDRTAMTITLDKTLDAKEPITNKLFSCYRPIQGAYGDYSHVEGNRTKAIGRAQHVEGEYNAIDPTGNILDGSVRGTYAHIVGNGTSKARSSAHAIDWNGNAYYMGDVYVEGDGTNDFEGAKKVATEDYVTTQVAAVTANFITQAQMEAYIETNLVEGAW